MKETAIKFLWKAPIERIFIGALLFTVYTQNKKLDNTERAYQQQIIQCASKTDSLRVYYNNRMETELRKRIKKYDKLLEELKQRSHES